MTVPTMFTSQFPKLTLGEAISIGVVAGCKPITKLGYAAISGTGVVDDFYANVAYVPLAAGQQLEVISTSAQDGVAGTGVLTVRIKYLDSAFAEHTADVTMNGVTLVATGAGAADIMYVNSFRVLTVGTGGAAAGLITLRRLTGAGAAIQSQIAAGETRARNPRYTVPVGKTLMIENLSYGVGGAAVGAGKDFVAFRLIANYDAIAQAASTIFFDFFNGSSLTGGANVEFLTPLAFPAGVTVTMKVYGIAGTDTAIAQCMWMGPLIAL